MYIQTQTRAHNNFQAQTEAAPAAGFNVRRIVNQEIKLQKNFHDRILQIRGPQKKKHR